MSDTPNYDFNERVVCNHNPTPNQGSGLHVGDNTNTLALLSISPTQSRVWLERLITERRIENPQAAMWIGSPTGVRTWDLRINSPAIRKYVFPMTS